MKSVNIRETSLVKYIREILRRSLSVRKSVTTMKLSKTEISRFCSQLQTLISAGVPLLESLEIVRGLFKDKEIGPVIDKVREGHSLAEAIRSYFPSLMVASIETAEFSGSLEQTLERLSKYYEQQAETESKIKSALIYPAFIIAVSLVSLVIMFVFVLPGFKSLFVDLNVPMPLFTRILIGFSEIFSATWYFPFMLAGGVAVGLPRYCQQEGRAYKVDRWLMKINFYRTELMIQFLRSLGSLLEGGVPVLAALENTIQGNENRVCREILTDIRRRVENGEPLHRALARHDLFPPETIQMIAVGENTGRLGQLLIKTADFQSQEKEVKIKRLTALLEPLLTLCVGLIVAIIAVGMFLPMINMISNLQ